VLALEGAHGRLVRLAEPHLVLGERRLAAQVAGRGAAGGNALGRLHSPQPRAPERLVGGGAARAQPLHVVLEAAPPGKLGLGSAPPGIVYGEHLPQHCGHRSAAQQDMVKAPHQHVPVCRVANERQPHGRRVGQVEAAGAVPRQVAPEVRLALPRRERGAVEHHEFRARLRHHLLHRLGDVGPAEAGAECVVPPYRNLPCALQALRVHRLVQAPDGLLHVDPRPG